MNRPDVIKSSAIVATATANTPSLSRHEVKFFFFYFINYLLTLFHNTALHHRHAKLALTRKQTPYYARLNESMKEKDSNLVAVKKELNLDVVVKKEKGKWHMCVCFLS